tara:strand:+ start:3270 stop:4205 length:936 start_codon:yes stop_codon:yes gene_type:complete
MFKLKLLKPRFWDEPQLNFYSFFLLPLSAITHLINFYKKKKEKKKFNIKTICVGNIYLGGTGKTQLVLKINQVLKKKFKTFVIKKDYPNQIDEQELLKKETNFINPKNRLDGLFKIDKLKNSVAIFDDGLQDKSIKFNLSIVCFNSLIGVGNGKLLPAGPLRESMSELKNYDAVFINGKKNSKLLKKIKFYNKNIKIFSGKYVLKNKKNFSRKSKYLAFCGIGNPNNFLELLKKNKFDIKKSLVFPDHYRYNLSEINNIKKIAYENNLKIITTEKDFMKIKKFKIAGFNKTIIDLNINNLKQFEKFLIGNL